ncbi:MAG: sigma-E factor negative regulatory protein [Burkholderiales bacterium]|nr:sigma-E factor negative regulatory protein [Burkholderiales bacterium]
MNTQELVSALADGELRGDELARGIAAAAAGPVAGGTWHAYHVIGDVLRSSDLAHATPSQAFLQRLNESLKAEAAIRPTPAAEPVHAIDTSRAAANDSQRWKLVAGFASVAAVAAIGWSAAGVALDKPAAPQLAVSPPAAAPAQPATLAEAGRSRMIRDEQLDKLLAAHRQWGGSTSLQTPSGFLRNATFEGPTR